MNIFGSRGHGLLVLFLTLPFLQPIPLIGLSTPFGIAIALMGVLMAFSRPPWLPRRLRSIRLESETTNRFCEGLERIFSKLERLIRPRFLFLVTQQSVHILNGLLIAVHGTLLSLPLPIPLSNSLPAITLALLSLGTLEEDGAVLILGYIATLVVFAFFATVVVAPVLSFHLFAQG